MAKMFLGTTPINSLRIHQYDISTNDATVVPSDLQAGITCYARGQKITGTGKSFEFAYYGTMISNDSLIIPIDTINIAHVSSLTYPVHATVNLNNMYSLNFGTSQVIGNLIANGSQYPISVYVQNNEIFINCDIDTDFEIFFGKDNYI